MENSNKHGGFAESPQSHLAFQTEQPKRWTLKIGKDGRLLIPAAARALMDLGDDGQVNAYVEDGELHVISPRAALTKIQEIMRPYRSETHSIVDEFIAEKRLEAAREEAEY
jgi:bifunctional DNA-binding transcriptional regulator/antitoxin component of YhaV-PrlF toxin-antitoxin module